MATRLIPTPFLTKTYQLVDDRDIDDVISWNEDGSAFVVWNTAEFARDLLPKYFKHCNFSSFIRQLNTYGFRKVAPDRWEFSNGCFRRGEEKLLCDIQRRKISVTASSVSPSAVFGFSDCAAEVIRENKRLKMENAQLNKELSHLRNICVSVSSFNSDRSRGDGETAVKPLDLLPMTRFHEDDGGGEK